MSDSKPSVDLSADDVLEQLLKTAAPRPVPSQEDAALARQAVRAEWESVTHRRKSRRRVLAIAMAATVLLGVFVVSNTLQTPAIEPVNVASIDKSFGSIYLLGESSELKESSDLRSVVAGQTIVTGSDAGMALAWGNGGSLRVDGNTRIEFTSADAITLRSGRIYFDSRTAALAGTDRAAAAGSFAIHSEHGVVTHVGTQFMAGVEPESLTVSVREGQVAIEGEFYSYQAAPGEQVRLAGRQRPSVLSVSRHGDYWDWVALTSPPVNVDGRSLHEFLTWACRELGLELRYQGEAERVARHDAILKGTIDTAPADALRLRLASAALAWRIDDTGVIYISESS